MSNEVLFQLNMILDTKDFQKLFTKICDKATYMEENEEEYIDYTIQSKGIIVIYRDSQYKKMVKLILNLSTLIEKKLHINDVFRKLCLIIEEYFNTKYTINDFTLHEMIICKNINVGNHENVLSYLKVIQRISKVKGFSPIYYDCFDDNSSFCLHGNSNNINFLIYDLEKIVLNQIDNFNIDENHLKRLYHEINGILRVEVRLTKPKSIKRFSNQDEICHTIADLLISSEDIFMHIFSIIIPKGRFYKKAKAIEIIKKEIDVYHIKNKMIKLVTLVPEKKSLHLAQKGLKVRDIDQVMNAFNDINLSPITISKRHNITYLKSLYDYIK